MLSCRKMCSIYVVHENGYASFVMDGLQNGALDIRIIDKEDIQRHMVNLYTGKDGYGKHILVPVESNAPLDIFYWNELIFRDMYSRVLRKIKT